jgi:hypothetical protein
MNFSCSGSAEANDTRRPVKKIGLTINILERTVTVSGLSVFAHVDSADDVNSCSAAKVQSPGTSVSRAASIALAVRRGT